jgi:outer membrane protein assembly factor BamD
MKGKYFQLLGVVLICFLLLFGCAGKQKIQSAPKDPAVLYTTGMVLFNKGEYKEAKEVFTRLKDYFPSDELYAPKADLRIADCYFFEKEYPEAITRYMEFKKQHPFHPDVPYEEYQLGLCYYQQVLTKDRDQKATLKALTAFQNVVANYPDSIFTQKAQEKVVFCQRRLAENELYIAKFYLRKGKYSAAEKRASSALTKYPACGLNDEALYYVAFALHKEEKDPEALVPLTKLIQDWPQSPFAKEGRKLLASLKAEGVVADSPASEETGMRESEPVGKGETSPPFRITSQRTQNLFEQNVILYTGGVVAIGEEVTIRCDSLRLTMGADNVPKEMVARDEVVVKNGEQEFTCNKAVWSSTQMTMVMTDDAKIRGIADWTRGDEITLHLDTGKVEIKGEKVEKMEGTGGSLLGNQTH